MDLSGHAPLPSGRSQLGAPPPAERTLIWWDVTSAEDGSRMRRLVWDRRSNGDLHLVFLGLSLL